jgi:CRISPR-associated protein Cas5t
MKALHVRFEGLSASYPYPFLRTGTLLSLPVPPYSSIIGMVNACNGAEIDIKQISLGYVFESQGARTIDIESTYRLQTDKQGRLKANPDRGLAKRQFHIFPTLDVYVADLALAKAFRQPATPARFGRSQDLAWISLVREVELTAVNEGVPRGTLLPFPEVKFGQVLPPLVDYYKNDIAGRLRVPGRISRYVAMPARHQMLLPASDGLRMFRSSDQESDTEVVVLKSFA